MSDAMAEVFTPDGVRIGYAVYHGSSDTVTHEVVGTQERAWEVRHEFFKEHPCEDFKEIDAIVYSSYGGGFHWPVKCCAKCGWIVEDDGPYGLSAYWGRSNPSDEERRRDQAWQDAGWPAEGHPFPQAKVTRRPARCPATDGAGYRCSLDGGHAGSHKQTDDMGREIRRWYAKA